MVVFDDMEDFQDNLQNHNIKGRIPAIINIYKFLKYFTECILLFRHSS